MGLLNKLAGLIVLAVCVAIALKDTRPTDIKCVTNTPRVDRLLAPYRKTIIGDDYEGYHNHIQRTLSYARHFLQYDDTLRPEIETALAFHDIALWTDGELNYLEPSVAVAHKALAKEKDFDAAKLKTIDAIIMWHHKLTPFTEADGKAAGLTLAQTAAVEAVRKADSIDASYGLMRHGLSAGNIQACMDAIPNAGFHRTLLEFGPRLHGANIYKIVTELGGILRW